MVQTGLGDQGVSYPCFESSGEDPGPLASRPFPITLQQLEYRNRFEELRKLIRQRRVAEQLSQDDRWQDGLLCLKCVIQKLDVPPSLGRRQSRPGRLEAAFGERQQLPRIQAVARALRDAVGERPTAGFL